MHSLAIDSVLCAVADPALACTPYERLDLTVQAVSPGCRRLVVGPPEQPFAIDFLAPLSDQSPLALLHGAALASGTALFAVGLRVADLDASLADLATRSIHPAVCWTAEDGSRRALLALADRAGCHLVLVQRAHERPVPPHSFPLRRLDHLAAVARPLHDCCHVWEDVLGVALAGTVMTQTLVIRQFRIGSAVLELLGPASADSPIHQRPHGLVSMASWEVPDLEQACQQARSAGFTVPDPAPGPLPGTRISTIPGAELGGVNMQLLQYV